MSDDFVDPVPRVYGNKSVEFEKSEQDRNLPPDSATRLIHGRIIAIRRGSKQPHMDVEGHQLDITVGDEPAYTELLVRVPQGNYNHLEGRHVVIQLPLEHL